MLTKPIALPLAHAHGVITIIMIVVTLDIVMHVNFIPVGSSPKTPQGKVHVEIRK